MKHGAQSVITSGAMKMLMLCVDSLDSGTRVCCFLLQIHLIHVHVSVCTLSSFNNGHFGYRSFILYI